MFSQTDNFLFMIIYAHWLLSPMSQKKKIIIIIKEKVGGTERRGGKYMTKMKRNKNDKEKMAFGGDPEALRFSFS